jgi:hypothetical protein
MPGAAIAVLVAGWLAFPLHSQIAVKNQGYVPFSEAPVDYRSENINDPVTLLRKKLDRGEVTQVRHYFDSFRLF